MTKIEARIGTHLTVNGSLLSRELRGALQDALTIPNPAKPTALREKLWGAEQMPDFIPLYEVDGWFLKIPRGFVHHFIRGMSSSGYEIEWIDERVAIERGGIELAPIALDAYQEIAAQRFIEYGGGLVEAPTGSGKTAIMLEVIRRLKQRSLIIVEKSSLGAQWVEQIQQKLGYQAGYIGEGMWEERDITVALRQSLWSAKDTIDRRGQESELAPMLAASVVSYRPFWERWGAVMLDEAHHAPAETLVELLQRFPAWFRGGASATLARDPLLFPIAEAVVGPMIHETTFEEAEARLVRPTVRVIESDFDFPEYHPTRREPVWDENRKREVMKTVRNNYGEMMAALIRDPDRNAKIAKHIVEEASAGHHCLVVSGRKEHLAYIWEAVEQQLLFDPSVLRFMLTGENSGAEAMEVAQTIDSASVGTITFSTVADEGFDVPRMDRLFSIYPSRKTGPQKQKMGRVTRRHPKKDDAIVYDVMDRMKLLRDQFRERRQQLYNKEGFQVVMLNGAPA